MKKITIILAIILTSFTKNFAQLYNKGAQMVIQNGVVLKVDGDFLNDINSNFKNESKVIINGNVTNNQTMGTQTAGLWEFNGVVSQTFSGIYPLQVFDVKFNNGAGFVLNNGMKIYNQASFTNGLVANTDASVIIFGPNATLPTIPTDASHVVGPVAKEGLATFTFPVGDNAKYQPTKADFTQNTSGFLAKYATAVLTKGSFGTTGTETTVLSGVNDTEYWDLQPFNEGNTTAQITIYWDGYKDAIPSDVTQRRVAHRVGTEWLNEGQSSTAMGTLAIGSVKSNLVSNWSPFALGFVSAAPLPLKLLSFSAKKVDNGNELKWLTTNEIGVSHFEIEKSENGKSFDKIGEVNANGGPSEKVDYKYLDSKHLTTNFEHLSYYRLKMLDLDGKYEYSKIIFLENEKTKNDKLQIYPNPVSTILNIENMEGNVVVISNALGQSNSYNVLKNNGLNANIDVSELPKGFYFLKAGNEVKKFVKE